jgi:hypothetical protein
VLGAPNIAMASVSLDSTDIVLASNSYGSALIIGTPITLDPQLGPLQNNGGPTQTLALSFASPAIDTGSTIATVDQRGCPRPVGAAADIGAFEAGYIADRVFRDGFDGSPACL